MDFRDRIGKNPFLAFKKNQTNLARSIILNKILQESLKRLLEQKGRMHVKHWRYKMTRNRNQQVTFE